MEDDSRFYQRPWFIITTRIILMSGIYAFAVYHLWKGGKFHITNFLTDFVLFFIFLIIWLAFFAQFILPVRTFSERQKIFDRLVAYIGGLRGPALFIKNGRLIERTQESERAGPGVVWLDSASAAVTHVKTSFKNVFGPGVHFTGGGEKIDQRDVVGLHKQIQSIGPRGSDQPFDDEYDERKEKEREAQKRGKRTKDEFDEEQKRRTLVSALTRDGIEVVPNISVVFKIDADAVRGDQPGSHFGYHKDAVQNAVINQAINPMAKPNTPGYEVAWNELPVYVAADLWREYLSKFKLSELFETNCVIPPFVPKPNEPPAKQDADALFNPITGKKQGWLAEAVTEMLQYLNERLENLADFCEGGKDSKSAEAPRAAEESKPSASVSEKTALQVINAMIKERMTNPKVPILDENGRQSPGTRESKEYVLLHSHGIRVISASVSNLRFHPEKVEKQLIRQWTANWMTNARAERDRIETARSYASLNGKEKGLEEYVRDLTQDLLKQKRDGKDDLKGAVRALLMRTRVILVQNDRMPRRASTELQELEDILQWLETGQQ